jgi:hypothetical protein
MSSCSDCRLRPILQQRFGINTLLTNVGVLPASPVTDHPRFSASPITTCVTRLREGKQQRELLGCEPKELNEQLRLAHLRGDLLTPDLLLNRKPGRMQWSYSIDCKEIQCQFKAGQSCEQQSGVAGYSLGAVF